MTDDLEQLAQRGASRQQDRERSARATESDARELMLLKSLRSRWTEPLGLVLMLAVFVMVALAYIEVGAYGLIALIPGFVVVYFVVQAVARWDLARQRALLQALPYGLDQRHYEALLSREYASLASMIIEVELADAVDQARGNTLATAVVGAMPNSRAHFDGTKLSIEGPTVKTSFSGRSGTSHSNIRLHAWFRRCAKRALRPIHAAQPIARIRVEIH